MVSTLQSVRDPRLETSLDAGEPIKLLPNASEQEIEQVIQAVYRQVLGNAHVMESERLAVPESRLKRGEITVRDFIRQIALSPLYYQRFVESCTRTRTIELNFKHLLGRAPSSYEELAQHGRIYDQGGLEAEIDAYLESHEYQALFGDQVVPYARGYTTTSDQSVSAFTYWSQLERGAASSDAHNRSRLNQSLMRNQPSPWHSISRISEQAVTSEAIPRKTSGVSFPRRSVTGTSSVGGIDPNRGDQFYSAYQVFKNSDPIELRFGFSEGDAATVIRAVYRHVLGNAYVMESERLTVPESQLKSGEISVREFVRQVAKSELYRSRFFDNCYRYRAIELNFKHLLGRAPDNFDEMRYHSNVLDQGTFEDDIDAYLDSEEYQRAFGEFIVPYYRGLKSQSGQSMLGFTNLFQLLRSASSSDKNLVTNQEPQLTRALIQKTPYGRSQTSDPTKLIAAALNLPTYTIPEPAPTAKPMADSSEVVAKALRLPKYQSAKEVSNPVLDPNRHAQFFSGYQAFKDSDPVELCAGFSESDAEIVIRAVYRQVLGNAYVMESERLTSSESQLKSGEISVREFVRQVAKSELYRSRFFDNCYRYRAIELNFKHLLGRAPDNFDEMRYHSGVLDQGTFEDDIDAYLDSDEYQGAFGENIVPYYRGAKTQLGQSMLGFTNLFELLRSASSSDKDLATNQTPRLTRALIQNKPYGKAQTTDANQLIAAALKLNVPTSTSQPVTPTPKVNAGLQETFESQAAEIKELEGRFALLRSSAMIGASTVQGDFVSTTLSGDTGLASSSTSLAGQVEAQAARIEALNRQIAEAQSLAAVGNYRLNKWRSRTFA